MVRCALCERSFEFAHRMQVENVSDGGIIGRVMLHFKLGTLIGRSVENIQVSMAQLKKGESTGFYQSQGLIILANFGNPKLTFGTIVILEVSDGSIDRTYIDFQLVIESLARILDIQAKVRHIVLIVIFTIFNNIGAFDWTSHKIPFRRHISLNTAYF